MTNGKPIHDIVRRVVDTMEPGLDRAVLSVLGWHVGKEQALHIDGLILACQSLGFKNSNSRNVRQTITDLRKQGYLIAAWATGDGGYYLCKSLFEYQQFRDSEYMAKVKDILETVRFMDEAAKQQFGDAQQIGLGI